MRKTDLSISVYKERLNLQKAHFALIDHEELIALKGTYANLYNMQLRIEDTGENA